MAGQDVLWGFRQAFGAEGKILGKRWCFSPILMFQQKLQSSYTKREHCIGLKNMPDNSNWRNLKRKWKNSTKYFEDFSVQFSVCSLYCLNQNAPVQGQWPIRSHLSGCVLQYHCGSCGHLKAVVPNPWVRDPYRSLGHLVPVRRKKKNTFANLGYFRFVYSPLLNKVYFGLPPDSAHHICLSGHDFKQLPS